MGKVQHSPGHKPPLLTTRRQWSAAWPAWLWPPRLAPGHISTAVKKWLWHNAKRVHAPYLADPFRGRDTRAAPRVSRGPGQVRHAWVPLAPSRRELPRRKPPVRPVQVVDARHRLGHGLKARRLRLRGPRLAGGKPRGRDLRCHELAQGGRRRARRGAFARRSLHGGAECTCKGPRR